MKLSKLDTMLLFAFQVGDEGPYLVSIMFDDVREFASLTRSEINNLSMWEEVSTIRIENIRKERRWRERTSSDRRKN